MKQTNAQKYKQQVPVKMPAGSGGGGYPATGVKTTGVKTRGNGAAQRGVTARGPLG